MPAKVLHGQFGPQLPEAWQRILAEIAMNPVTTAIPVAGVAEPMLKSLGKPISELLDLVLKTEKRVPGLPRRVKLTEWNARKGTLGFRPEAPPGGMTSMPDITAAPFEATPADVDALINAGHFDVDQPPQGAVDAIRRKLMAVLGQSK